MNAEEQGNSLKINFRLAENADIDTLIQFMEELYRHDHIPFDESSARHALQQIINDFSLGKIWLIHVAKEVAGYLVLTLGFSLEYHGRDAFIDEIYIQEKFRGLGIGKKAITFAEERCRSLGVRALHLEVERSNTGAQAFYRKTGFEDHDRYLMTKWIK